MNERSKKTLLVAVVGREGGFAKNMRERRRAGQFTRKRMKQKQGMPLLDQAVKPSNDPNSYKRKPIQTTSTSFAGLIRLVRGKLQKKGKSKKE
jgi:hypothetical protein